MPVTDDLRIEWMRLDDLVPAKRNSRTHDLDALTAAVTALGFTTELKIDESSGELVWGHGRLATLRRLRDKGADAPDGIRDAGDDWEVPVVRGWSSRDALHADAVREADNAQGERGGYDPAVQLDILSDLAADAPDYLRGTSYTSEDLDKLLAEATGGTHHTDLDQLAGDAPATPAAPWDGPSRDPFDRPAAEETDDDEQWDTGQTVVDPEDRPEPVREDPPGDLDKAPAFRTLHPTRAIYHDGTPEGAQAVAAWLRGHAHSIDVKPDHTVMWSGGDGRELLIPGKWATRDGQTGQFEVWTREEFADRFVPANESARRLMRDSAPMNRDTAGTG